MNASLLCKRFRCRALNNQSVVYSAIQRFFSGRGGLDEAAQFKFRQAVAELNKEKLNSSKETVRKYDRNDEFASLRPDATESLNGFDEFAALRKNVVKPIEPIHAIDKLTSLPRPHNTSEKKLDFEEKKHWLTKELSDFDAEAFMKNSQKKVHFDSRRVLSKLRKEGRTRELSAKESRILTKKLRDYKK